jgi:hypothetical protein
MKKYTAKFSKKSGKTFWKTQHQQGSALCEAIFLAIRQETQEAVQPS